MNRVGLKIPITHLDAGWKRNGTSKIAKIEFFDWEYGCLILYVGDLRGVLRRCVDEGMRRASLYGCEVIRRSSLSAEYESPLVYLQTKSTQRDTWDFKNGGEVGR